MKNQKILKPSLIQRFMAWSKTHKKLSIVLSILVVILIAGGVTAALTVLLRTAPEPASQVVTPQPEPEPEPPKFYSPLTGALVTEESLTERPVTAVMVENSPEARPQSGLKESGIVFESIAEGGITRFLVLYQEDQPTLIGPVRSIRLANIDWVTPFNASIAHVGGSWSALQVVRNGTYRDIDQFFNAGSYWRSTDRFAPHNVYTNFERLDALNTQKGYTSSTFTGFVRADTEPLETPEATRISVTMSSALYNSSYVYNAETNRYARSQGGAAHLDREKGQIAPRVLIVMKTTGRVIQEDGSRIQVNPLGSGEAVIFQDGTVQEVTWKKSSRTAQLQFLDAEGEPVPLARGQTWISAIPVDSGAVTWR